MLRQRLFTGSLLIVFLILLAVIHAMWTSVSLAGWTISAPLWWILGIVLCTMAGHEIAVLCSSDDESTRIASRLGALAGLAGMAAFACGHPLGLLIAPTVASVIGLVFSSNAHGWVRASAPLRGSIIGLVIVGIPLGCWIILVQEHGGFAVAALILVVKSTDIGAYFIGRSFGRHKLIHWLSPGKTWEGLAGGFLFGAISTWIATRLGVLPSTHVLDTLSRCAAFGLLTAVIATMGDLTESLLKRSAGVKDSGRLLPGMGGVLDAVDSLIYTGPCALALFGIQR
ncbi:MAG: phosphatidate cytidylyltransferase [Planctomycetota bacterium]|nr:phosphatidate cytidylyltransferase [Planctomycetota bacterium]